MPKPSPCSPYPTIGTSFSSSRRWKSRRSSSVSTCHAMWYSPTRFGCGPGASIPISCVARSCVVGSSSVA